MAGGGHAHHGLLGEIDKLFTLQSSRLHLFAIVILAYAAIEGIEAVGLWYQRRWAEYLTFLVTVVAAAARDLRARPTASRR